MMSLSIKLSRNQLAALRDRLQEEVHGFEPRDLRQRLLQAHLIAIFRKVKDMDDFTPRDRQSLTMKMTEALAFADYFLHFSQTPMRDLSDVLIMQIISHVDQKTV